LIQLVRSRIGARPQAQELLRSLKLSKVGHARVVGGSRLSIRAITLDLEPWIRVYPLTLLAAEQVDSPWTRRALQSASVERDEYDVDGTRGVYIDMSTRASRDFFRLEHNSRGLALAWSTALPLATVLAVLRRSGHAWGGVRTAPVEVDDWALGRRRHGELGALVDDVDRWWRPYATVIVRLAGLTLVWRAPAYPRHVQERVLAGDLRLLLKEGHDPDQVTELLAATATPVVTAEMRDQLLEIVGEVGGKAFLSASRERSAAKPARSKEQKGQ